MKNRQCFLSFPQIMSETILHRSRDDPSPQAIGDVAELTMGWLGGYQDQDHHLAPEGCLVGVTAVIVL